MKFNSLLNLLLPNKKYSANIVANEKINTQKVKKATKIILQLQSEMKDYIAQGSGPFWRLYMMKKVI